jgi:hypothetical protein
MTDIIPKPPAAEIAYPEPVPPTLIQTLQQKLHTAHIEAEMAESKVKAIENEIATLPKHMHDLTEGELAKRVRGWFE